MHSSRGTKDPDARADRTGFPSNGQRGKVNETWIDSSLLSLQKISVECSVSSSDLLEKFASSLKRVSTTVARAPLFLENVWGDAGTVKSHDTFYAPH